MKKKYLRRGVGGVLVMLVVWWSVAKSWSKKEEPMVPEKIPFLIQVATIEDLSSVTQITKYGTLMWAQEITISSQVAGRVSGLPVRAGEDVEQNDIVVALEDSSSSATFQAQRAQVQLDTTRSSYDLTVTQLDQAVTDARNALEQAKANYATIQQNGGSTATLQSQQLEEQISKAELDYQTLVASNNQTIQNYIATSKNLAKDVELLYQDITISLDQMLGVSDLYEQSNDYFENSLWAQNSSTRREAQTELRVLLTKKQMFDANSYNFNEASLVSNLQQIHQNLQILRPVLDKSEVMLQFTTATSTLTQTDIDGYRTTVDTYQTSVQTKSSTITEQINIMQSFLSTYMDTQQSSLKQRDLIIQQSKVSESTLEDNEEIARLQVERAQANYDNAVKNKTKNIPALQNTIDQAQIAVSEAYDQLDKFKVLTPIKGTIGRVLVDQWEEVLPGTPLITIKSTNAQQVEINLTQEELMFVTLGQEVMVESGQQKIPGIITSISKAANQNFTYTTIIELTETVELFGDLVSVHIDVRTEYPLIPLNVITLLNNNEWLINRRDGTSILPLRVQLGKVWDDLIEIRTSLDEDIVVITSDVKNYNATRHTLQEQK